VSELNWVIGLIRSIIWGTIAMKIAISFISGVAVCCLIIFGIKTVIPSAHAETDNSSNVSGNFTQSLINLIPDFEKIYREALIMPFEKAKSKIYDKDIADFYNELLDRTGLTEYGSSSNSSDNSPK
jgi:hypothetical protein